MKTRKKSWYDEVFCKVHYDYDNPAFAKGLGKGFEPESFARDLKKAHVEAISFHAKDVFGFSTYNTRIGTRHPGLKFDLLRAITEACHSAGVRIIYYLVNFDQRIGEMHPDWVYQPTAEAVKKATEEIARDSCGETSVLKDVIRGKKEPNPWVRICHNSPFIKEVLFPMVTELCERYNPDGFQFDMFAQFTHTAPCYCPYCEKQFRKDFGKPVPRNPKNPLWFKYIQWYSDVHRRFEKEVAELIRAHHPEALIFTNGSSAFHHPSPPSGHMDFLTVDPGDNPFALSTWAKYMVSHGQPFDIFTTRFLQMWSDWMVRPGECMKQNVALLLANGSGVLIGDKLPPECKLLPTVIKAEREVFEFANKRKPFVIGAKPVPYIGLLYSISTFNYKAALSLAAGNYAGVNNMEPVWGASRALSQSSMPFVIFDETNLEEKLRRLKTLIVTGQTYLSKPVLAQIKNFVKNGGGLILTYDSGMFDENGRRHLKSSIDELFGVRRSLPKNEKNPLHYILATKKSLLSVVDEDPLMVHADALKSKMLPGAEKIADLLLPVWHNVRGVQGPPGKEIGPAIITSSYGKGKVIYCASEFPAAYLRRGNPGLRLLMKYLVELVTKDKLIEVSAPPCVEVTLFEKDKMQIIHFVNYHIEDIPEGRGIQPVLYSESTPPVHDIDVKLKVKSRVKRVMLQPEGKPLKFTRKKDYVAFVVPMVHIHSMAVIEC